MPEVCEIAITAHFLQQFKIINNIEIIDKKFHINGLNKIKFPLKIKEVDSYGKLLWFEIIDSDLNLFYIINTFGLKGSWNQTNGNVCFTFEKKMYYDDPIRFGTISILEEKEFKNKLNLMAPDFLRTEFTDSEFVSWIKNFLKKNKKRNELNVVKVLMEQKKSSGIGSGLGNYLVTEILYSSQISPHRKLSELTTHRLKILAEMIKYKVKLFYMNNDTHYIKELNDFVKIHRKGVLKGLYPNYHPLIKINEKEKTSFNVYKQTKDPNENEVIKEEIIKGRHTYWCPNIQK